MVNELLLEYEGERLSDFWILDEDWDMITLQFRALNLLQCINGQWEVTGYGDNYMTSLLAVPKGRMRPNPLPASSA